MTDKEIIRTLMAKQQLNSSQVGRLLGFDTGNPVLKRMNYSRSLKVYDFLCLLDVLGFEAVVRPKGARRTKYKLTKRSEK